MKERLRKHALLRKLVQAISGLLQNCRLTGWSKSIIYTGPLKNFCVPGMNCYSCPAAIGACPIGSLQAVVGSRKKFSFYIVGYLALIGTLLGRFVCGWLCLFGLIQELLYKIPVPKLTVPRKIDRPLRWLKYVFLVVFVLLLPALLKVNNGLSSVPYFCKLICPVGILEGAIPLAILDEGVRGQLGFLFRWKFVILAAIVAASMFVHRPFCKYICPLGAFYGIFQRFSFLRLTVDTERCVGCGACTRQCKMNVDVVHEPNSAECIRCGACTKVCPTGALKFGHIHGTAKAGTSKPHEA
jgi:ferredoxin-type protein NapH